MTYSPTPMSNRWHYPNRLICPRPTPYTVCCIVRYTVSQIELVSLGRTVGVSWLMKNWIQRQVPTSLPMVIELNEYSALMQPSMMSLNPLPDTLMNQNFCFMSYCKIYQLKNTQAHSGHILWKGPHASIQFFVSECRSSRQEQGH